jgi:hypothetical protein
MTSGIVIMPTTNNTEFNFLHRTVTLTGVDSSIEWNLELSTGLAACVYSQYEETKDKKGRPVKLRRGARILLVGEATGSHSKIFTLDIAIGKDGRLANLPDKIPLYSISDKQTLRHIPNADPDGLTLYGLLLTDGENKSVKTKSTPSLLESADGRVHMYFQGKDDKFLCAQLDTDVIRAQYSASLTTGILLFTAHKPGNLMNEVVVSLKPTESETCGVTLKKKQNDSEKRVLISNGGAAIALNDEWLVCGNSDENNAFVYRNIAGTWQQETTLTGEKNQEFGATVAITKVNRRDKEYIIIGAPAANKVYLYDTEDLTKTPHRISQSSGKFGTALAADSDILAIGAPDNNASDRLYKLTTSDNSNNLLYLVVQEAGTKIQITDVDEHKLSEVEEKKGYCTLTIIVENKTEIWDKLPRDVEQFTKIINGFATESEYKYINMAFSNEVHRPNADNGGSGLISVFLNSATGKVQNTSASGAEQITPAIQNSGSVFIYSLTDDNPTLQQILPGFVAKAKFSKTLALQGDTLLVSSNRKIHIYKKSVGGVLWRELSLDNENSLSDSTSFAVRWPNILGKSDSNKAKLFSIDEKSNLKSIEFSPPPQENNKSFGHGIALGKSIMAISGHHKTGEDIYHRIYIYYKIGDNWSQKHVLTTHTNESNTEFNTAIALHGSTLLTVSNDTEELFLYNLPTISEYWSHVPTQLDHFLAVLNGTASEDPNDLDVRHGQRVIYDYQNMHFVYSLPVMENTIQKGRIRFISRYIKGRYADLDPLNQSIMDDPTGAIIKVTQQNDNQMTLTLTTSKIYRLYKSELDSNKTSISITETWSNLPVEAWKIVKILNGRGNIVDPTTGNMLPYQYSDASTTDTQVANLSGGSELFTLAIDGIGYSLTGTPKVDTPATKTDQGLTPPRSSKPQGSAFFAVSTEQVTEENLKQLKVIEKEKEIKKEQEKVITISIEGKGGSWTTEPPNYALKLKENDKITLRSSSDLDLPDDLTMEAWINPNVDNTDGQIIEYHNGHDVAYAMGLHGGKLFAYKKVGDGHKCNIVKTTKISKENWTHIAAAYQSSYALRFQAAKKHFVDCGNNELFNLNRAIHIEAWVKRLDTHKPLTGTIVSKWGERVSDDDESDGKSWKLSIEAGKPTLTLNTVDAGEFKVQSTDMLSNDHKFHHISALMDIKERQIRALNFDGTRETRIVELIPSKDEKRQSLSYEGNCIELSPVPINHKNSFTFEMWIKLDRPSGPEKTELNVSIKEIEYKNFITITLNRDGKLFMSLDYPIINAITIGLIEKNSISWGAWTHIAIIFSDQLSVYSNGKVIKSPPLSQHLSLFFHLSTSISLKISGNIHCKFAEMRCWKGARTENKIKSNYKKRLLSAEANEYKANGNLLGYWPLSGVSGEPREIISGQTFSINDNSWVEDEPDFDVAEEVSIEKGSIALKNDFTVEFWCKRKTITQKKEWILTQEAEENGLQIGFKTVGFYFSFGSNNSLQTSYHGNDEQWHHYACVLNGTTKTIYIDGIKDNNPSEKGTDKYQGEGKLIIGKKFDEDKVLFSGHLHGICVWNKARKLNEIRRTMHKRLTGDESGLMLYLPLDDGGKEVKNLAWAPNKFQVKETGNGLPTYDNEYIGIFGAKLYVDGACHDLPDLSEEKKKNGISRVNEIRGGQKLLIKTQSNREKFVIKASDTKVNIGRDANEGVPHHFNGFIAEVRIWQRGLPRWEIQADAHKRLSGREKGLVANWQFNEGKGKIAYDTKNQSRGTIQAIKEVINELWIPDTERARWHFYINGELQKEKEEHSSFNPHTNAFTFGKGFAGIIDELRIWKQRRTDEQIEDNRYRYLLGSEEGLVGYWPLNEDEIKKDPYYKQVLDQSGRGNHASFEGSGFYIRNQQQASPMGTETPEVKNIIGGHATRQHNHTKLLDTPVVAEYGDMQMDDAGNLIGVLKRCYLFLTGTEENKTLKAITGYKVGDLETIYLGQVQTQPTLIGYIEGAPPIPAENLHDFEASDYNGSSWVELLQASHTVTAYSASVGNTQDHSQDVQLGFSVEIESLAGLGVMFKTVGVSGRAGLHRSFNSAEGWNKDKTYRHDSGKTMTKQLELRGQPQYIEGLGSRFMPNNVGYALVKSGTAEQYALRLKRRHTVISYELLPSPDVPQDWNIIIFQINPRYVKNGTLDGKVGLMNDVHYPRANQERGSYFKPL